MSECQAAVCIIHLFVICVSSVWWFWTEIPSYFCPHVLNQRSAYLSKIWSCCHHPSTGCQQNMCRQIDMDCNAFRVRHLTQSLGLTGPEVTGLGSGQQTENKPHFVSNQVKRWPAFHVMFPTVLKCFSTRSSPASQKHCIVLDRGGGAKCKAQL